MSNPTNDCESLVYSCECGVEFENVELLSTHLLEKHNAILLRDSVRNTESQVKSSLNEDINRDVMLESIDNVESTVTIEEENDEVNESNNNNQQNIQTNNLSPSTEHALHEYFCKTHKMDKNEKIRICETCRKMFLNKQSFISHCLTAHTGHGKIYGGKWRNGRPYTCEKCGETFLSRPNFLKHQAARHSEIQPFRCPVCLQSFTTKHDQKTHFRFHTEGQIKVQDDFKNERSWKGANDNCVTCDVCNKDFKNKQRLVTHMRIHSTERPYQCLLCPKSFRMSINLKAHSRIHTGEKPFPCAMCPKRFRNSINLVSHKRIHTGERPYSCETCPKAFRNRAALSRHIRVHTGEKPFTCSFCSKAFSQSNSMKLHIKTVHMKLPWPYKRKPKNAVLDNYKFEPVL